MDRNEVIGELREKVCKLEVEWKIPDFLSLPGEINKVYFSPEFLFDGLKSNLQIFPYGEEPEEDPSGSFKGSEGWIGLYISLLKDIDSPEEVVSLKKKDALEDKDVDHPKIVCWTFCIKRKDGKLVNKKGFKEKFTIYEGIGFDRFLERSELLKRQSELTNLGALTVTCTLSFLKLHPKKDSRCTRLSSLSNDFKSILNSEKRADVVLKVKDCEISAHKLILESRSPVFAKMFAHDMEENRTGVVRIEDVDENVLRCILSFIYSGEVEDMSSKNVRSIYVAADKYDLQALKELCMSFMQENLSTDLICDVLAIADIYNEMELKQISKRYFAENLKEIIKTDMWKAFKIENRELAWAIIENVLAGV